MSRSYLPEPLCAFRAWRVHSDGDDDGPFALRSMYVAAGKTDWSSTAVAFCHQAASIHGHMWGPQRPPADQKAPPPSHPAPHEDCSCGLHAMYTLAAGQHHAQRSLSQCVGLVSCSGRVVECERGVRAERMAPLALLEGSALHLEEVAEAHGLPVLDEAELVAFAGWHGELRSAA